MLANRVDCWVHGAADTRLPCLDLAIEALSHAPLTADECALPTLDQRALLIYTSGTTGLPKAANISHFRLMQWSHWFAGLMDMRPADRHVQLPADVSQHRRRGGATGAVLVSGGAVVMRERFSGSRFWRRRGARAVHTVSVHRRAVSLPATGPARARRRRSIDCACAAAMVCAPRYGNRSRSAFAFRRFSSTTPRLKAVSHSTTAKGASDRSVESRPSCRIGNRWH